MKNLGNNPNNSQFMKMKSNSFFFVGKRSWTLVTQKLPLVNGRRRAPDWAKCKYSSEPSGIAAVNRDLPLEIRAFNVEPDLLKSTNICAYV